MSVQTVKIAKPTKVTVGEDARGCPIPGRTYEVAAACGLGNEVLAISLDRVDGDVCFAAFDENGRVCGEATLTLATAQELHHQLGVYLDKVQAELRAKQEVH